MADTTKPKSPGESGKIQAPVTQEVPIEYRSSMTRRSLTLSLAPIAIAVILVLMGVDTNGRFAANDLSRLPFVLGPIAFGVCIIGVLIVGTVQQLRKKLIIGRREVIYDAGHEDRNFSSTWSNLAYSPPAPGKRLVRSLLIGDGTKFAQFYDIFTPQFDKMVEDIDKRKGQSSLTSGRMRMGGGDSGRLKV